MTENDTPIETDGIEGLRSLGAPPHIMELAEQLKSEGKEIKLSVSNSEEPASVALMVDGLPVATFRKSVSLKVEQEEAVLSDPRLLHAPVTQEHDDGTRHVFIGQRQLVQILLARGFKIPLLEDERALGCEIFVDGKPFDRTIEVVFTPEDDQ